MEGRKVRYWPYPFGYTYFGGKNADGCGIKDAGANSAEGQILAQAREEETKRILYVALTRAKRRLILAEGGKNTLELLGDIVPEGQGIHEDGYEYDTTKCADEPEPAVLDDTSVKWFDEARSVVDYPSRYWSPSRADSVPCTATSSVIGDPAPTVKTDNWNNLGNAVHAFLAAIPALGDADHDKKIKHAEACLARWKQSGVVEAEHLVRAGDRLRDWVEREMPGATWHIEALVSAPKEEGGQWGGSIDLLLEAENSLAVIDHKSVDLSQSGWIGKAEEHSGQLSTYVNILTANGKTVKQALIHLPLAGGMVVVNAK